MPMFPPLLQCHLQTISHFSTRCGMTLHLTGKATLSSSSAVFQCQSSIGKISILIRSRIPASGKESRAIGPCGRYSPFCHGCCNLSLIGSYSRWSLSIGGKALRPIFERILPTTMGTRWHMWPSWKNSPQTSWNLMLRLPKQAKEEFSTRFDEVFIYQKNSMNHVKTKAADITKQYQIIKGHMDVDE